MNQLIHLSFNISQLPIKYPLPLAKKPKTYFCKWTLVNKLANGKWKMENCAGGAV